MPRDVHLEMSYRNGRPVAGYLYLDFKEGDRSARSRKAAPGLVVDYADDGRPIGIEVTAPSVVTIEDINRVLEDLHQEAVGKEQLAPLLSA